MGSARVKTGFQSQLARIERRLRETYGQPRHHNPTDPLDDLIFLMLSRMTQEIKYTRTYQALRAQLPTWDQVLAAPSTRLERILSDAGLARTKSKQIQFSLKEIKSREGEMSLARLRTLTDDDAESYLTSLSGVSAKTARCVMLYALDRNTFPVDTHVWRTCQRLGIASEGAWSDRRGRELEERIPRPLRKSLHVTLLSHGRQVCVARKPKCAVCVLNDICPIAKGALA